MTVTRNPLAPPGALVNRRRVYDLYLNLSKITRLVTDIIVTTVLYFLHIFVFHYIFLPNSVK